MEDPKNEDPGGGAIREEVGEAMETLKKDEITLIKERLDRLEAASLGSKIVVANGVINLWKGKFHWHCNRCTGAGIELNRAQAEKVLKLPCPSHPGGNIKI